MAPTRAPAEKERDNVVDRQSKGPIKRRNRVPLSCESCRARKLKCDRQKPCQNCKARDMQSICAYATDEAGKGKSGGNDDVGDRIHRLEALVSSLVKGTTLPNSGDDQHHATTDSKMNGYPNVERALDGSTPYGAMASTSEGGHFVGESHWEAALRDITAIKKHIEAEPEAQQRTDIVLDADQPAILGGVTGSVCRTELLESLPPKPLADRLVTRFWETYDPSVPLIVHKPTFMSDYESSWASLDTLPLPKLGLFFSVYCLALQSYQRDGDEPPDLQGYTAGMANLYRQRTAQCILLGDRMAPVQDFVQCFLIYCVSEYSRLPNGDASLWTINGILVRKAMLLGYHRDPDSFPSMKPFEAEMRRRLWHALAQLDLLFSFQLGLPSMIQYSTTDVAPPRSLFEEELYENMPQLPPSRPSSEPTPVWYLIGKHHIFKVFAEVVQHLNSIKVPSDNQVLELNQRLTNVYGSLPDHLKMKSWEQSYMDTTALKMQRMYLQSFYDKVTCTLNRRFIAMPRTQPQFAHPRALCIESALSLLSIQTAMHQSGTKWYVYSLTRNDFILATVIICLVIYTTRKKATTKKQNMHNTSLDVEMSDDPEDIRLAQALENARNIWIEIVDRCPDALRACKIIDSMEQKVQEEQPGGGGITAAAAAHNTPSTTEPSNVRADRAGGGGPAMTPESLHDVQALMVDWAPWDSIIQGTNFEGFDNLDELWGVGGPT